MQKSRDGLGEANVFLGLGALEAKPNPEVATKHLYQAAHIYESIGLEEQKRTALEVAAKLGLADLSGRRSGAVIKSGYSQFRTFDIRAAAGEVLPVSRLV